MTGWRSVFSILILILINLPTAMAQEGGQETPTIYYVVGGIGVLFVLWLFTGGGSSGTQTREFPTKFEYEQIGDKLEIKYAGNLDLSDARGSLWTKYETKNGIKIEEFDNRYKTILELNNILDDVVVMWGDKQNHKPVGEIPINSGNQRKCVHCGNIVDDSSLTHCGTCGEELPQ